jgi:hypothetical protein
LLTIREVRRRLTDDCGGLSIAPDHDEMKSEIGSQFSRVAMQLARAAAWVTMVVALGLFLVIVFGRPSAASTNTSPGTDRIKKTGPWVYVPVYTRV